jgi:hypothetical protein
MKVWYPPCNFVFSGKNLLLVTAVPNGSNVGAMDDSLNHWFAQEILVHEAALLRYMLRTWPHRDDVHDLRQESSFHGVDLARSRA